MKKHLRLSIIVLLLLFFAKVNAQTFTITAGGKEVTSVCLGIAPTFTCTSGATDVSWTFGDGRTGTGSTTSYQYAAAGTYTVTMKDNATGIPISKTLLVNDIPKASYSVSSASGCTGNPITFTSSSTSTSPIVLYKWDFGDGGGSSITANSIQHSYNSSGTFTPTLIAQDQNGCSGTSLVNKSIQIGSSDVQVSFQANGTQFYSCDNSITLANTTNENGKTGIDYTWDFGDGSSSNDKAPGTHTYSNIGAYTVSLKASYGGNTGCAPGFTKTVYIGKPSIAIDAPSSICAFSIFNLSANVGSSGFVNSPTDLSWQIDNGNILNGGSTAYFNNVAGSNQIRVTNINGCPNTATKNVSVTASPQFTLSTTPSYGICVETMTSTKAVLADNSAANNIQSYKWDAGDGSAVVTNTVASIDHLYGTAGSYTLSVAATNTSGCASTVQIPIAVKQDCIDNGYGSTYNPVFSFSSKSCDEKYTITIKNKNSSKPVKEWIVDGTIYPAVNDAATVSLIPPVPVTATKIYNVQTVFQDNSTDNKKIEIINERANFAIINTQNATPTKLCANNVFTFNTDTSLNAGNVSSFLWTITDSKGQVITTLNSNNPTYIFTDPGTYTVTLAIADIRAVPCSSTISKTIDVKGLSIDFAANATSFCNTNPTVNFKTQIKTSSSPIKSTTWSMGDGYNIYTNSNQTDTTVSYQYNYTGGSNYYYYAVLVQASDESGCVATNIKYNYINIYDPKVSFSTPDTLLCSSKKIIINNTSNVPNGTYLWKVGNFEKTYQNRSDFNNTFTSITNPSSMNVYLKVTDAGGCTKDTLVENYIRFTKPKAVFGIANEELLQECPSYTLVLRNQSQNTSTTNWNILTNYSNTDYTQPDSIYFTVRHPGSHAITLIASLDGCSDTTVKSFVVKGPIAKLNILGTIGCTPFNSVMKIEHNDDVAGYQWDFGDGNTLVSADADSLVHTYRVAGTFLPKVLVSGFEGCTDSLDIPSQIVASHLSPTFSAFNVADKCSQETPKFLNTTQPVAMPINQFIWNWGTTLKEENSSKDTIPHLFSDISLYIPVSLTAVTDYCSATSDTVIVSPHFANNVSIQGDSAICDNINLYLKGIVSNTPDSNNTYSWYTQSDSLIYSGNDSILNLPINSSFGNSIKLRLTNTFGCTNDAFKSIAFLQSPTIDLIDSVKLCNGDSTILQAESNGTFTWKPNNGISNANTSAPTIYPNKSTYYYVSVTNSDNCKKQDSIWVQIDDRIGVSFLDNYKACLTDTTPIEIVVKSQLPSNFEWSALPTDNSIDNNTTGTIRVNPRQMTTYHFVAKSQNVCPDEVGDILVQYANSPTISFPSKTISQPAGAIFTLDPEINNLTGTAKYTWTPDTRLNNRFLENPTVVADKDITYTLSLLDEYGCTISDSITVKVLCNSSKILMANAFTPNGDGKNDRFYVSGYGIKNVVHFVIIDRWGKKVFERNNVASNDINQGWDGTINGKAAEPGSYLYVAELECTEGNKIPVKGSVVLIR